MRGPVRLSLALGCCCRPVWAGGWVSGFLHEITANSSILEGNRTGHHHHTLSSVLGGLASGAKAVASDLKEVGHDAFKDMEEDWVHWEDENELEGHSKLFNNVLLFTLICIVVVAAVVGQLLDEFLCPQRLKAGRRPRGWVIGMLVASYMMLIPAISSTLFSFNIYMDIRIGHLGNLGYNLTRKPVTESMLSVIGLLLKTGGTTGACCVILYAMVLPTVKVVLLVLGELWRNSEKEKLQRASSTCIMLCQVTSKWATPDLFAYILLLFLFRHMNHPPLVRSNAVLDAGFCCFGVFCLCSTFSTLAIHRPQAAKSEGGNESYSVVGNGPRQPLLEMIGYEGVLLVVAVLEVIFAILLLSGLLTPCMGLHLETHMLLKPKGPVPKSMEWMLKDAIEALHLKPMLKAEVSLWHCLTALGGYMGQGEASCVLAFIMLAVFAVAITVADMAMLGLAAFALARQGPNTALSVSRVLKHIGMLDVFCMGVFVVCMAGQAYEEVGFNLGLRKGLVPLALAEIVHYLTFHFVTSCSGETEDGGSSDGSSLMSDVHKEGF